MFIVLIAFNLGEASRISNYPLQIPQRIHKIRNMLRSCLPFTSLHVNYSLRIHLWLHLWAPQQVRDLPRFYVVRLSGLLTGPHCVWRVNPSNKGMLKINVKIRPATWNHFFRYFSEVRLGMALVKTDTEFQVYKQKKSFDARNLRNRFGNWKNCADFERKFFF